MSRDLPVIYRAFDVGEADIIVHWLAGRGIEAVVKDRFAAGTFEVQQIVAPAGIEVCVLNAAEAESAREELAAHFEHRDSIKNANSTEPVDATCEECGKMASFEGTLRGRVRDTVDHSSRAASGVCLEERTLGDRPKVVAEVS